MAYRRVPFSVGEWYHCYSRGVDKRVTFGNKTEYERFVQLLYLANDTQPLQRSFLLHKNNAQLFRETREKNIVSIGAYSLMPNHFHIMVKETQEGGITKFMRKLGTAYTMYFNVKHERVGNLFVKPFRSKHVAEDRYAKYLVQYIHFNPAELFDPGWKKGSVRDLKKMERLLREYPYSSFGDYWSGMQRPEYALLDQPSLTIFKHGIRSATDLVEEAASYYADTAL